MHELLHKFCITIFTPVTLSPRYFGAPLYQSLQFIETQYNKTSTKIDKMNTYDEMIKAVIMNTSGG